MRYEPLVIGDLVAKVPIIQGGMGVGVSLSGLAGAVAKEGGVGIISTAQIGFKPDEVLDITDEEYENDISAIMDVVDFYGETFSCLIPVVVAGGISDSKKVARAMELGADGVQVASRFVTTYECDASQEFKNAYLNAKQEDIIIVKSPVGMPGRAIANKFIETTKNGLQPIGKCYQCIKGCQAKDIPYCITKALVNSVKGNVDEGLIFCGADTWKQNKMQTVKEVMHELISYA